MQKNLSHIIIDYAIIIAEALEQGNDVIIKTAKDNQLKLQYYKPHNINEIKKNKATNGLFKKTEGQSKD